MAKRTYADAERLSTMSLALEVGVVVAAKQTDTPVQTVYTWFNQEGGLVEIHRIRSEMLADAGLKARRAVYEAVIEQAKAMPSEAFLTFREMLRAEATALGASEAATGAQAGATAIAELHVHVDGEEIIVPREDPES